MSSDPNVERPDTILPVRVGSRVLSWAPALHPEAAAQAARLTELPVTVGDVRLMADAHPGRGVSVGTVLATQGAVVPAAVGTDIGCGMIATRLSLTADRLPNRLHTLRDALARAIPIRAHAGRNANHRPAERWLDEHRPASKLGGPLLTRAVEQFGTLGGGNHFLEVSIDEDEAVWVVVHSGSRGPGATLGRRHIDIARAGRRDLTDALDDPELAWLIQGTPEFAHYIEDMHWCEAFAFASRRAMADAAREVIASATRTRVRIVDEINCHHNFCALETHDGAELWVTRKGAIRAGAGDRGVIPGSMGTDTYLVEGLGSPVSLQSASHGAGRAMSRAEARQRFRRADLASQMGAIEWNESAAKGLVDEAPAAYKPIEEVMHHQRDLVRVAGRLRQVVNLKGSDHDH